MTKRKALSEFILNYLLALPVGCILALVWANTAPESYYRFAYSLSFPVNGIGMVFFFALIAKEVVEATVPGGALHPFRRAALPIISAIGGCAVAIACYLLVLWWAEEPMLLGTWAVACAVDIPASYVITRWIFGPRHPAVAFLLLLTISADVIGVILLAPLQSVGDLHPAIGIGLMTVAIGLAAGLRWSGVKNFWLYLLGPGLLSWWALYLGGVHPGLALVPIIPFFPHARHDAGLFVDAPPRAHDTITNFERWWQVPVQGVLLLFGLVNAGVPLRGLESGIWGMVAASFGRPLGIVAAAGLGLAAGLHLPHRVSWRDMVVAASAASIGLVFALFFSSAVMSVGPLLLQMKTGALLTVLGGGLAFGLARLLHVGRFAR